MNNRDARDEKFQEWMNAQAVANACRKIKRWEDFRHMAQVAHQKMEDWKACKADN